jgi:hypothetical protein
VSIFSLIYLEEERLPEVKNILGFALPLAKIKFISLYSSFGMGRV